jgi:hypothetical protein
VPRQIGHQRRSFGLQRMLKFGPALLTSAEELCIIGPPSQLMKSANVGT